MQDLTEIESDDIVGDQSPVNWHPCSNWSEKVGYKCRIKPFVLAPKISMSLANCKLMNMTRNITEINW
jgi:hypothetical protein